MIIIHGENVTLRPIGPQDFAKVVEWTQDPEVSRYLEGDYPQTLDECPRWYRETLSNRHKQCFAIQSRDGTLIGDMELDHITWRSGDAELRVRIGEKDRWDQGLGTDAVLALLGHAFRSMHLSRVYLRVFTENRRAIRCYEKASFRREGIIRRRTLDGSEREILLMRILRDEFLHRASRMPRAS